MRKHICTFMPILFLSGILIACSKRVEEAQTLPLIVPISFEQTGKTYTFDVDVGSYVVSLDICFYLTEPRKKNIWSSLWDKPFNNDPSPEEIKEARRLERVLGYSDSEDLGVPAKFRVQIISEWTQKVLLDKVIERPKTRAGCAGRYASLFHAEILNFNSKYIIRVMYLQGAPELAQVHAKLRLHESYEHIYRSDLGDFVKNSFPPQDQAERKKKRAQAYRKLVDKSYATLPQCFREQFRESIYKRKIANGMWVSEALLAGAGIYRFSNSPENWQKFRNSPEYRQEGDSVIGRMKYECAKTSARKKEILYLQNAHQFSAEKMRKFSVRLEDGIVVEIREK